MSVYTKKCTAAVLVMIFLFITGTALAGELDKKYEELYDIQSEIKRTEERISTVRGQEQSLSRELENLERRLAQARRELAEIQKELENTEEFIRVTNEELLEAENDLKEKIELLCSRLRALYENGSVTYLEVLLGSASFNEFLSRVDMMQDIIGQDVELMEMIQQKKDEIEAKKEELEKKKEELIRLEKEADSKKQQLEADTARREQLLAELEQERKAYETALDELEETSKQIEDMIRRLQMEQSGSAQTSPGQMHWPTGPSWRISSPFGNRVHPILGSTRFHSGIDMAAPHGQPVYAAAPGKVIFSGVQGGYGNTVIIDHGGGISTLYAHNSTLTVSVGEFVSKGQMIARIGSTGLSTGPHVHFEVRVDGAPQDPMNWL